MIFLVHRPYFFVIANSILAKEITVEVADLILNTITWQVPGFCEEEI